MSTDAVTKEKEEISRQQYWHTTAVLTFMALVANLTKPLAGWLQFWIALGMLAGAMCLGFRMVILCHKEYCARDNRPMSWCGALFHSFQECKGALFCNALIFLAGAGLILLLASTMTKVEPDGPANRSQPALLGTNSTPLPAGSGP